MLILKGIYFGSYEDLHEFSDCRCDIVCIWYNDKFLKKGQQNSDLRSFQNLAPSLYPEIFLKL